MTRALRGLSQLQRLGSLGLNNAGPGWFTSIMGTGILAICATISPVPIPFGPAIGIALWSMDAVLFAIFAGLWVTSGFRNPGSVLATLRDPVKAQLWGAPPMACFTIAVGFLKIGTAFLRPELCVAAAQALWIAGVAGSLFSAFIVPYLMFTKHTLTRDKTYGSWLLPVVPPIVASVPAALLSPTWPASIRGDMLALAYALLGIGVILAAIIIVIFYSRLVYDKVPDATLVPTMWIVVGPLGQSIAGIIALGIPAKIIWPEFGHGLAVAGLAYGVLVWGFANYWLAMAIALTVRGARKKLPFTLGWWAFTFPVGVLTAGTDALCVATHAQVFAIASLLLIALLASMWALVSIKTFRSVLGASVTHLRSLPPSGGLSDTSHVYASVVTYRSTKKTCNSVGRYGASARYFSNIDDTQAQ